MFKYFQQAVNFFENSTNVRYIMTFIKHRLIRTKFQILSKLSLTLTARKGIELFFRTSRYKRPEREKQLLTKAKEKFIFKHKEKELIAWAWGKGETILLVHGWNGRGTQLGSLIEPLVLAGYRVVAFDAPGHGDSNGNHLSLVEFSEIILSISKNIGFLRGVISHSLGSAATTLALTAGLDVSWAIYIAPPFQPRDYIDKFSNFMRIPPEATSLMKTMMSSDLGYSWESLDIPNLAKSLKTPLLVFHDKEDKDVSWSEGNALVNSWPGAKLLTTQGLGHRKILHDKDVMKYIVHFIEGNQSEINYKMQKHINKNIAEIKLDDTFPGKKCNQEGCENYVLESWDNTKNKCTNCLINEQLFNPMLRWV